MANKVMIMWKNQSVSPIQVNLEYLPVALNIIIIPYKEKHTIPNPINIFIINGIKEVSSILRYTFSLATKSVNIIEKESLSAWIYLIRVFREIVVSWTDCFAIYTEVSMFIPI